MLLYPDLYLVFLVVSGHPFLSVLKLLLEVSFVRFVAQSLLWPTFLA